MINVKDVDSMLKNMDNKNLVLALETLAWNFGYDCADPRPEAVRKNDAEAVKLVVEEIMRRLGK